LGQNFLLDGNILEKIALSVEVKDRNVLEIGPGIGNLTQYIWAHAPKNLHLVELDSKMVEILNTRLCESKNANIQIHHEDVLKFAPQWEDYIAIGNIPYYITSAIITHFLYEVPHAPTHMAFLMARDVAEKILEQKGNKSSYLSKSIGYRSSVECLFHVKPHVFYPAPKVESSVLLFTVNAARNRETEAQFVQLLKDAFSQRRKKLLSNLVRTSHFTQEQ